MNKKWFSRFVLLLVIVGISIMTIIPTVFNLKEDSSYPVKNKINLGLDLQGGLYIVLGIDFDKVYLDEVTTQVQKAVTYLKLDEEINATIGDISKEDLKDPRVQIVLSNPDDLARAKDKVREYYDYYLRLTSETPNSLTYGINNSLKNDLETNAVSKSIEVIRNRIDEFGVSEPEIVSQGEDRIVVQLPGVKDIDRAKDLIGQTAKLEFKIVNDDPNEAAKIDGWLEKVKTAGGEYKAGSRFSEYVKNVNDILKDDLPTGHELVFEKIVNALNNEVTIGEPYLINSMARITGDDLQDARVAFDPQDNRPYVGLNFKTKGAQKFANVTEENVGKRMAIILDGNVYSAPNIQEKIAGGNASITLGQGNRDKVVKEASDLSLVLRAGALPVELEFQEQRIVGPSLGAESIEKARFAALVGALCVFAFILFYYKVSGFIALLTLSINILIVLACLVGLEATLTLPGIAGIALTIGMAVDANIIIFERIKEEIRLGVSGRPAVEAGFAKAFWTIIDANLTTAVAGLALLNFGTGPIRGFAVTLLIGIIATVYSSYFVGKLLFEIYMDRVKGKTVSI